MGLQAAHEKLELLMLDKHMARIHWGSVQRNIEANYSECDPQVSSINNIF